ncbi:MAG: N-6 DNA methylase [Bacteroidales bacterium]|nr:N-6 DNA methylase [Bacteroidales bacterium]
MVLSTILKDSDYRLTQFQQKRVEALENTVTEKAEKFYVNCLVRKKDVRLTPEEAIRQLYIMTLRDDFGYPLSRMELEYAVSFGREKKRADIVIFDKDQTTTPYIIVELKKPKLKDGKEQLKSYCSATGAPIGIWSNGESISYYHRKDPNFFEDLSEIPKANEKLSDILKERWTINDLIKKDKLVTERKSLKDLILEMEDEVLANSGMDVFEELFKLIFTKLFDEMRSGQNKDRHLEFRNYGDTETELKNKIQTLFNEAKKKWDGVFSEGAKIMLTPSHLSICVASLQDVKLFNSNLEVVDEAFEYLMTKSSKSEKGQYFTPRYVIDMCVKMLNPQKSETMIDTASGSCGFPVHTIFYVWEQILIEKGLTKSHLFTTEHKPQECIDYVNEKVFAIDFDERAVRVARTLNLIAGDGQTNVLNLNTLDWSHWNQTTTDPNWQDIYFEGWKKLKKLRAQKDEDREFNFDILMANPPFAGDIKESKILAKYALGKNSAGKYQTKVGRDILFIERNLDFLKPGGRMAIVLPQGRFNNSSDKQIREFIAERCRILAVVGLHGNVFKPHTGTKTSVLFVQKWDEKLCPKKDDYPIFFATMQEPSKDNSGDKIYVRKREIVESCAKRSSLRAAGEAIQPGLLQSLRSFAMTEKQTFETASMASDNVNFYKSTPKDTDEYALDSHEHLIVKHDLFNHDGLTKDGIAEAFIEFAKKEKLSFF